MIFRNVRSILLLLLISKATFSQKAGEDFIKDSLAIAKIKLIRPQLKFDNRINFYGSQGLPITGFDIGVLLADRLRLTAGYYKMSNSLKENQYVKNDTAFGTLVRLEYASINTELIYKDMRFFSLGMPLEIGAGINKFQNKNLSTEEIVATKSGGFLFVNFGLSGTFKPMRFLGLKAIIGYRKVAYNQVRDFNFDGLFTSIGLNVDVHFITKAVKMYRLKKHYQRGNNITNAVDILTN